MLKLVSLRVTSWRGMSFGATHYYGTLEYEDENRRLHKTDIMKVLTQHEADELNREDDYSTYKSGDKSERFTDKKELIEKGIELAKELFGENIVIRLNAYVSAQPERTLYAPESILWELHNLETQWFELWDNGAEWDTHEKELSPIDDKWRKLNKKLDIRYS